MARDNGDTRPAVRDFRLPHGFQFPLFGLLVSGFMSLIVSGIVTYKNVGAVHDFLTIWRNGWFFAWAVAFPAVLIVAPAVRRLLRYLVKPE